MAQAFFRKSIQQMQDELYAWLKEHGPATKLQMVSGLGWHMTRVQKVLGSQPDWLVGVAISNTSSKFGKLALYHCEGEHVLGFCGCGRKSFHPSGKRKTCQKCVVERSPKPKPKRRVPGVDLRQPTDARPGTPRKEQILGARWDAGLPMHVEGDEYESRPGWNESQEEPEDWDEDE